MRDIKFFLNGSAVDPRNVRQFSGLYDGTKWEDLTEQEREDWLLEHSKEEWQGKPVFAGDVIDLDSARVMGVVHGN